MLLIQMVALQVITFVCIVFVLVKIMNSASFSEIKRMKRLSEESAQKIRELNDKIAEAEKQYREKLDEAQKEANKIKAQAGQEAERQKEGMLSSAKGEADRIIKQALNTKEKVREELKLELQEKSVEEAVALIAQVLGPQQAASLQEVFVRRIIKDLESIDVSRFNVDTHQGRLIMADKIDAAYKDKIVAVLSAKTGKNVVLDAESDASLIAGIVIHLGNLVIDGSLRGRLNEAREGLKTV